MPIADRRPVAAATAAAGPSSSSSSIEHACDRTSGARPQRRQQPPSLSSLVLLLLALLLVLLATPAHACDHHDDHHDATPATTTWPDTVSPATRRRLLARADRHPQPWDEPLGPASASPAGRRRTLLSTTARRCGTHVPDAAVRQRVERALAVRQAREASKRVLVAQTTKPQPQQQQKQQQPASNNNNNNKKASPPPPPSTTNPAAARRRESAFVPSADGSTTVEIPTYVTVVQRGEDAPTITDAAVQAQLDVLNAAFGSSTTNGSPVRWVFALKAPIARVKTADSMCDKDVEARIKKAARQGGAGSLNLYFTDLADCGLLGYSTWPWDYAAKASDALDGVVIHHATMPGGDYKPYNMGFTTVHETGHWMGLYHVWQNGCEGAGDSVDDTPATASPTEGCPVVKGAPSPSPSPSDAAAAASASKPSSSCPGAGEPLVGNPMDYTDDACMQTFTVGQQRRMMAMYEMYRR